MQAMSDERLEELRQIAGGLAGEPKSDWMDELIREIDRLRRDLQQAQASCAEMRALMDSVRDAARNRNPAGPTLLDFFVCWNEQYEDQIARLKAAIEAMHDGTIYLARLHPDETWTCAHSHSMLTSQWTPGLPTAADAALAGLEATREAENEKAKGDPK